MKTVTSERRLTVAAVSMIGVGYGFARYGYGLFLPRIRADFGLSVTTVGAIGSATYLGSLTALALVGALIDRTGPRLPIALGGLSATIGMTLVAAARGPALLTAGLVLAGTSSGWIWAPYSDAVDRLIPPHRRERVLAIIPSGTAFAVTVAGPLALLALGTRTGGWRLAWLIFAAVAAAATLHNLLVLPGGPAPGRRRERLTAGWFLTRRALPLYLTALAYGLLGAVYWTYAVDAITDADDSRAGALFWTMIGISGTAGILTGRLIAGAGVRRSHTLLLGALATAVALIGIAPGSLTAVAGSAGSYGFAFMAMSGLLAVWSYQVFPERPSTGFSATVLCIGLGSVAGPASMGLVAARYGLGTAFLLTAALSLLTVGAAPSSAHRPPDQNRRHSAGGRTPGDYVVGTRAHEEEPPFH